MNRRTFLGSIAVVAGGARLPLSGAGAPKQPSNILLINVDDLGWTDLGCFGSRYYETPNIDRLRAEGMKFTNAYAACAVCSPTRAAIMTGRYPARIGITDWVRARFQGGHVKNGKNPSGTVTRKGLVLPKNHLFMEHAEVTIAEMLKPLGYVSCHIGKWHLGPDNWYPDTQGFDCNIGGCDLGQPLNYFDPYTARKLKNGIPTLKPRKKGEYLTDREADEAARFIRDNRERPFFLHMCHYAVHTPIQAKKDLVARYTAKKKTNQKNPVYAAMVHSVDEAVGTMMKALDDSGQADNTLVIFTSDNGGLLGPTHNAPLRAGKGYPYEGGIRIPQIVRWPGKVAAGSACDTPVISVDFLPTIAAAAGAPLPDRDIDGESLMPLLRGTGDLQRECIFWHFPHFRGKIAPYSIVRCGPWKLLKRYHGTPFELYNLAEDISETTDLADKMPARVKKLNRRLETWLKEVGATVPRKA